MSELRAFSTVEHQDEWGSFSISVQLGGITVFTKDTGSPRPTNRLLLQGLHEEAIREFARRLQRLTS